MSAFPALNCVTLTGLPHWKDIPCKKQLWYHDCVAKSTEHNTAPRAVTHGQYCWLPILEAGKNGAFRQKTGQWNWPIGKVTPASASFSLFSSSSVVVSSTNVGMITRWSVNVKTIRHEWKECAAEWERNRVIEAHPAIFHYNREQMILAKHCWY